MNCLTLLFRIVCRSFSGEAFRKNVDENTWSTCFVGEDPVNDDAALTIVCVTCVFDFGLDRWSDGIALQIEPDVQP